MNAPPPEIERVISPPLPPLELRRLVCHDDRLFELPPDGYAVDGLEPSDFRAVFDFGCGCGRIARQLLAQPTPPERYMGVDINREMVTWCSENLSPLHPDFRFEHHDVYNKNLGKGNSAARTAHFPVGDREFSLLIAHSVFTHISLDQTIFYLHEMRRILQPGGLAKTTWFLFSRKTFPMLAPSQVCLFVNEDDPTNAVIYDWEYLRQAFIDSGFRIRRVRPPGIPGHQWEFLLEVRRDDQPDALPSTEDLRRNLCAAPADDHTLNRLPHREGSEEPASAPSQAESTMPIPAENPIVSHRIESLEPQPPAPPEHVRLRYTGELDREGFEAKAAELDWWYHSYYFENGFEVRGDYDIGADIHGYGFPASMKGWKVLDVGSGAGWFSHYFEQLGADVTAVDARGYEDFDVYGRDDYLQVDREPDRFDENGRPVYHSPVNRGLWIMKDILQSKINFVNAKVYDLRPELFGGEKFDLVFLGALLCHLRDPIGALMAAHRVCKNMVIASTPVVIGEPEATSPPRQYLPYTQDDKISWWLPNEACFRHWFLAAGFRNADPGPSVILRCDQQRVSPEGRVLNGDQQIRVGRAFV
ncbi:MAG: methyltransferase domain-containing protein [Acidobacteria bacterium]|nr:methyltransferase domain-containing protein [Acidobacteriota bacterium]